MSGAAHGGPGAHFGSNHHHDAHRFGSSASTQTQELPASTIRGLQHEQLVVNPLYLNLLQEQASLNGKIDLLQQLLDQTRPPLDPVHQGYNSATATSLSPLPTVQHHTHAHGAASQQTIPVHNSAVGSPFSTFAPAYNPTPSTSSNSNSLTPFPLHNDSHSAYLRLPARSARKQADYPHIKYWTKDDAMNDPAAHKNPNVRKPTLKVVLERLDGSQVDDNRFADIQSHVRTACSRYLDLSVSYTKQTPSAQEAYIGYAESLAPELSYCDETGWKAVMMARTFIDGKTRRGRDATAGGGGSSGSSRPRRGAGGSKRKDGSGSPSEEPSAANEDEEDISTEQLPLTPGQDHPGLGQSSGQGPNKRRRFPAAHPDLTSPEDFPVPQIDPALST